MRSLAILKNLYKQGGTIFFKDISKEDKPYFKHLQSSGLVYSDKLKVGKALKTIHSFSEFKKFDFVDVKELNIISMVVGKEKNYKTIIFKNKVKDWVAIGWIDLREAEKDDYLSFPIVMI